MVRTVDAGKRSFNSPAKGWAPFDQRQIVLGYAPAGESPGEDASARAELEHRPRGAIDLASDQRRQRWSRRGDGGDVVGVPRPFDQEPRRIGPEAGRRLVA